MFCGRAGRQLHAQSGARVVPETCFVHWRQQQTRLPGRSCRTRQCAATGCQTTLTLEPFGTCSRYQPLNPRSHWGRVPRSATLRTLERAGCRPLAHLQTVVSTRVAGCVPHRIINLSAGSTSRRFTRHLHSTHELTARRPFVSLAHRGRRSSWWRRGRR